MEERDRSYLKKAHVSLSRRHCAMLKTCFIAIHTYKKKNPQHVLLKYMQRLFTSALELLLNAIYFVSSGNRGGDIRHPHKPQPHKLKSNSPLKLLRAPVHTARWAFGHVQQFPFQKGHKEPVALEAQWRNRNHLWLTNLCNKVAGQGRFKQRLWQNH